MGSRGKLNNSPAQRASEAPVSSVVRWLCYLGLAAAVLGLVAHAAYFWHYVNDDAYITFRYSRFLALGRGPYYNVGEHVEGYTNFLLMLLLAPVYALGGESAVAPLAKGLGVFCGALSVLLCFALTHRLDCGAAADSPRSCICGVIAAGLVALAPSYALNSTSGLETLLFGCCLLAGVYLGTRSAAKGRWLGSGLLFAAAALTRPEGALLFAIYWCTQALFGEPGLLPLLRDMRSRGLSVLWHTPQFRRHLWPDAAIVLAAVVGQLIFRVMAYDGQWLPNTYFAKAGGFWGVGGWDYIWKGMSGPFLGWVGIALGLLGWLLATDMRPRSLPAAVTGIAGTLLPVVTGTDWMIGFRMLMPYVPLVAVVVAIGWGRLADRAAGRVTRYGAALALLALPLVGLLSSDMRRGFHDYTLVLARGYADGHRALAEWLRHEAAKPGDTIALMDIGIVGYLCSEQNIVDVTGLTDRYIASSRGTFLDKRYDPAYVLNKQPAFIVLAFWAAGNPDVPLPRNVTLSTWTDIEADIRAQPQFTAHYVQKWVAAPNAPWTEQLAAQLGAVRIFQHTYPGRYYLLTVFRRQS
jgi:arabinofuranosyltransferase